MQRSFSRFVLFSFFVFILAALSQFPNRANAQDRGNEVILPAGTLLHCTLNETNFSSKTADVGDPVICNLGGVLLFNRSVFSRGAYLEGHLEADKDPGHFFGKGYLKLEFDRIGTPEGELPVPLKIVGVRGYQVNKQGDIVGHGHATRDAVEWMLPPLWPVKVLTLPARGPRPTLKGEEPLTLRLMDDVAVPTQPETIGWRNLGRPSSQTLPGPKDTLPNHYIPSQAPAPARSAPANRPQVIEAAKASPPSPAPAPSAARNVLVLRNGNHYVASALHVDGNLLSYTLTDGTAGTVRLGDVDWTKTFQANSEHGVTVTSTGENTTR